MTTATVKNRINVSFLWTPDLVDKLKELAAKDNRNLNNYLETVLKEHCKINLPGK